MLQYSQKILRLTTFPTNIYADNKKTSLFAEQGFSCKLLRLIKDLWDFRHIHLHQVDLLLPTKQ